MKIQYYLLAATLFSLPVAAQETYENANLTSTDLNGTARYVGMGGAMEALGADVSTIGSNPAGIGLFRRSQLSVSGGLLMQSNGKEYGDGKKTNASFDQIGFVYTTRASRGSNLNFGFNYTKGKNFDFLLNASGKLGNGSQNNQSYLKYVLGSENYGGFDVRKKDDAYIGFASPQANFVSWTWNQLDYLYFNTLLPDATTAGKFNNYLADSYTFDKASTGYVGNYDFNISGSIQDQFYLGLTFGLKDVHYDSESRYNERLSNGVGDVSVLDIRRITGTGFDITAGIIVRPIASSPFRIGAYVKTPTWYDLTTSNVTRIDKNTNTGGKNDWGKVPNSYDYKLWTPWKFGLSLGHTVGNYLALGLTYEFEDHSTLDSRINDGGYYNDYYGTYYETSSADKSMNKHTKQALKGVSTLKMGAEYKPTSNLALRLGYNYISPKYNKDAQKDPTIVSPGSAYSSSTDFVNWDSTNRFTFGIGYQINKFNVDLAYQYSMQKGTFYPFSTMNFSIHDTATGNTTSYSNQAVGAKVDNNRGQLLLTVGYRL
ncbi:MAG: hemin receptor [Prevotella pallens]|uniref:hemin receptor n=1 Tax=Prevotella pallens TaxID=60133 RepID=UPI001CB04502|nr:hemin receptor [Prevotella pallens]MBF1471375.1 hemin receptor [Prevotella pallens]